MRVLGIDPGLGRTGIAVVDGSVGQLTLISAGCVETAPNAEVGMRLASLFVRVEQAARDARPEVAAVEELYFSTNRATAISVAQARGAVLCALAHAGVPIASYTPNQVKESVAGFGGARKPQVARMACRLLGVERIPGHDDVADACAVAICHHHRAGLGVGVQDRTCTSTPSLERAVALARTKFEAVRS